MIEYSVWKITISKAYQWHSFETEILITSCQRHSLLRIKHENLERISTCTCVLVYTFWTLTSIPFTQNPIEILIHAQPVNSTRCLVAFNCCVSYFTIFLPSKVIIKIFLFENTKRRSFLRKLNRCQHYLNFVLVTNEYNKMG